MIGKVNPRKGFVVFLGKLFKISYKYFNILNKRFISYARKPQALSLGMNGILSKRSQVKPGEAEQIPT
jgi:hypothetical protein